MGPDRPDLDEALRGLAAEERRRLGDQHPEPDVLLAYQQGDLPELRAERIRDHLAICSECGELVLDFAAFPALDPPEGISRLDRREIQERWRGFQEATHENRVSIWRRPAVLLPLAAGLLAATIGLGAWGLALQRDLAQANGPRGSVLSVELAPTTVVSRGTEERGLRLSPRAQILSITLDLVPGETYPDYRVDCRDAAGRMVARNLEVLSGEAGSFTLIVPLSRLPSGRYRFELVGLRQGRRTPLAEYRLRISK